MPRTVQFFQYFEMRQYQGECDQYTLLELNLPLVRFNEAVKPYAFFVLDTTPTSVGRDGTHKIL
jgi:hypothetical protein